MKKIFFLIFIIVAVASAQFSEEREIQNWNWNWHISNCDSIKIKAGEIDTLVFTGRTYNLVIDVFGDDATFKLDDSWDHWKTIRENASMTFIGGQVATLYITAKNDSGTVEILSTKW